MVYGYPRSTNVGVGCKFGALASGRAPSAVGYSALKEKSNAGTILIGIAVILAVMIGNRYLFQAPKRVVNKDEAITVTRSLSKTANKINGSDADRDMA